MIRKRYQRFRGSCRRGESYFLVGALYLLFVIFGWGFLDFRIPEMLELFETSSCKLS